ncbi:MAG: DUF2889 domain-containing protein [Alphaproteobacteria bacterium]
MPLSDSAERDHVHTRRIDCRGFRRADGLWDVEGHLTDVKTYPFRNDYRGTIEPGEPLHDMWLRLTIDDGLTIRAVEAVTDRGPYHICGDIAPAFDKLVGLSMRPGFTRRVRQLLGGVRGCTHLVELLVPMATTAFQTIFPILSREHAETGGGGARPKRRPPLLDTCHAFASDGPIVKRYWPDFHTGDETAE